MMRRRGGLVRGVARTAVVAGTATAVSGRVRRRQDAKWSEQEQAEYEQQVDQQPAPAAPAPSDDVAQLQQIADLHAQGILTDEEFTAKKAQILGL
jgi:hypothetical protein